MTALDYMKQKLPLSDVTLKHAEVADIEKRSDQSFDSVVYFADKLELARIMEYASRAVAIHLKRKRGLQQQN